jgi:hypothetical protein
MQTPRRAAKIELWQGNRERLVAIFLLGVVLFTPPITTVFGHGGGIAGIPLLYVYMFSAWAGLTALVALIVERWDGAGRRR